MSTVLAWGTVRPASFPDRVAAAAAAGYDAIGLSVPYYRHLREQGWTHAEMRRVLDDFGISIGEVEVIFGFCAEPGPANVPERPGLVYADPEVEAVVLRLADEFGVPHAQAVGTFDTEPPGERAVRAFAALCDRAAPHGLSIALEFVPYTNIPDVATAATIVSAAGRPNGGLCVDSWHFFRGNADWHELAKAGSESFTMVQVNDGPVVAETGNVRLEAVSRRRCPGQGEFDLRRFLDVVRPPGDPRPISVEVYSTALDRLPSADAARAALAGLPDLLRR
ncbi:sugar phosphate isomerase/epimerase family protein [Phytohabitans sp. ZYX-F-186]|uniref:Sugar phosphate isomerase/epimerase family protein n=1 Tax=Phytohabitans maris TaxID=3071409 RepID=A0ABU0ZK93_9ACTN|nr:sugar phosphate isomerase/epimerase family protein [Phytohabitans sp. ZYX-F-186]MDQ7907470.1 sugar phosphate isomerase/epimerase family protein [Phytohabitans sp. ZYX-F-186]